MLHAGGASAFLCRGPRPCAAALERCACRKAAGRACPAPTFYAGERFPSPRGVFRCHRRARSGQDRSLQTTRYRCIAGRDDRLSKKVCSPLGPLCEGAPPAGGGGENCTAARNISGYGKVLSLRPFGAPPSQREVFRHAAPPLCQGRLFHFGTFFHLFCSIGIFFDCFAQIGCFCGSYYTIMIKYRRMYIFTARLLRLEL